MNKIKPKKELGQNFLTDAGTIDNMVSLMRPYVSDDTALVEIGPGLGAVTKEVLANFDTNKLTALELDPRMVEKLKSSFAAQIENDQLNLIQTNVLDWLDDLDSTSGGEQTVVIGSLPYYITSPIIHKLIYLEQLPKACVLLIQKEVAQKISAVPPDASYFSSFVQTFFEVEMAQIVEKEKFEPVPKVDGAIMVLKRRVEKGAKEFALLTQKEKRKYEGFLHRAYSNPRKMLNKVFAEEELDLFGLDGSLRAQNVGYEKWVEIFKKNSQELF